MLAKIKKWFIDEKKADEDLYIRILLWAHERQETGFTFDEIRPTFNLSQDEDTWVRKIFLTISDQDRKFFEHIRNDETVAPNRHIYSLNEKGIMAAINYKSLAHAEKSSQRALWLAAFSILLTALGIFLQWRQTRLAEIQAIPEQINQARAKQNALDFCKQNPTDQNSGLYLLNGSGKIASCLEVLKTYK